MTTTTIISEQARQHLNKDLVEFYLQEADKQLDGIVNVSNNITERAYVFLSAIIAILTGLIWIVNELDNKPMFIASFLGLFACLAIIIILLIKVICIHTIWITGKKPSEFNINGFLDYYTQDEEMSKDDIYINIVADHLDAIEAKIALNIDQINIRTKWFGNCLHI